MTTNDSASTDNPFVPGIAKPPPFMGRRPDVERILTRVLNGLKPPSESIDITGPDFLYLYGPRGTGKTVQLNALRHQIRTRPEPDILLTLNADMVGTEKGMHQVLFRPRIEMTGVAPSDSEPNRWPNRKELMDLVLAWIRRWHRSHSDLVRDVQALQATEARLSAGFGSITLTLPEHPDRSAGESLLRLGGPVLITLDEAHMVEPAALRILLNAVQEAGERIPLAVALAGTPDLTDCLHGAGASYWDRGYQLRIGRLEMDAAYDVIKRPLLDAGLTCDSDAVLTLIRKADCYPFFLQLYGREAFDAVQTRGTNHLGMKECQAAIAAARDPRRRYYERRRKEFQTLGEQALAREVALAFQACGNVMTAPELEKVLDALGADQASERETFMRHKGYICEGAVAGTWEPGIPSLMEYMIEMTKPATKIEAVPQKPRP